MNNEDRELFGGAIRIFIPNNFCDVSKFRQVPDNQEVFVDSNSEISIIVELLEAVCVENHMDSANIHFMELVELNSAKEYIISQQVALEPSAVPFLDASVPKLLTVALLKAPKFEEEKTSEVQVFVAVIRLLNVQTDLVISINNANPTNESANQLGQLILQMLSTLKIVDWKLFG
jgi:hypothetical protein